MNTAFLLIGGNIGDRQRNLGKACQLIEEQCGDVIQLSGLYETEAWGYEDQPSFLNQVVVLETELMPIDLMEVLLAIEQQLGRIREEKFGPRIIDIDILLIDDITLTSDRLTIPHPSLHLRRFALIPLTEVAGSRRHPIFDKSIAELLTDCPDTLEVTKIS